MHCSNNGTPIEELPAIEPPMETAANNKLVVERLSEDKYADELHKMCLADVAWDAKLEATFQVLPLVSSSVS